jgi:hypothetical protein
MESAPGGHPQTIFFFCIFIFSKIKTQRAFLVRFEKRSLKLSGNLSKVRAG